MGYLACVSRKLDKPLAVIIQSTSAAGKSSLMDAILNMMPEEERVQGDAEMAEQGDGVLDRAYNVAQYNRIFRYGTVSMYCKLLFL